MKEYRITEGIGNFFNKRYEVQESYSYHENGNRIESWHMVFCSADKDACVKVLENYASHPPKAHKMTFEESIAVFN